MVRNPTREAPLAGLNAEYDRLVTMLNAARPAGGSRDEMLAAISDLREVVDDLELLFDTLTFETYETTTASTLDVGIARGTDYDRTVPQARNNTQRKVATLRVELPHRRTARGLPERLVA